MKNTPIGYSESKMGRGMAIFFMTFATILSVFLVNAGMDIKYTLYLFGVAVGLSILFLLSDLSSNKKSKAKILHMEKMLKCPYVIGSVVEVKKYYYTLNRKLKEIKPGIYVKSKDCVYTVVASFANSENNEVVVESDPYATNPERNIKEKRVKIYYSEDNEYWIDLS